MGGVGWVVTCKAGNRMGKMVMLCGSLLASQSQELLSNKQQQKTGATVVKVKSRYSESL